ncbi:NrtA/SsuA/CpmA family ABC transporter substrate-binding protein [Variovorax boronicumulans]|uniref:NrtA/SsuA/CpmA family ABC transporter substrate-binding protein n=1 Tax=Variovorax boronicumulans TaxID=436515 RepID=UPI001C57AAE9
MNFLPSANPGDAGSEPVAVNRRRLLQGAGIAAAAASGLWLPQGAGAQNKRNTDSVRLAYSRGVLSHIARERGELQKTLAAKDIKVEWVGPFPNLAPAIQAMVGGSTDFAFWGSAAPALASTIAGTPLVFTQFDDRTPRSSTIIVKKDSGIHSVKDLIGKRVAVNRSGIGEFLLVAALEKFNLDRNAVEFVYLNPADASLAFGQSKVDAWSMWAPFVDIARDKYDAKDIFNEGKDLDFALDFSGLTALRQYATDNSAVVREVISAFRDEAKWVNGHVRDAELVVQKDAKYNDAVRDHLIAYNRQHHLYEPTDQEFLRRFQRSADWLTSHGVLPKKVNVSELVVRT